MLEENDGNVACYITILPYAKEAPFAEVYPELLDLNVFESFRNQGIRNQLLEEAEKELSFLKIR